MLRADQKSDVNQTCQQLVFSPIGAWIRIWCTAGAVERRSQMFVYRLSPFPFSLLTIFFTLSPNRKPVHRLDVSRRSRVTTLKKFTKKRDSYAELLFWLVPSRHLFILQRSMKGKLMRAKSLGKKEASRFFPSFPWCTAKKFNPCLKLRI